MKKCFKRVTGVADNKLWTMADEYQTTDYEGKAKHYPAGISLNQEDANRGATPFP